jgi:hypothetical protein
MMRMREKMRDAESALKDAEGILKDTRPVVLERLLLVF